MAQEITIPRLGWSMEEGIFGEWLKASGDYIQAGEMIFLLEGEKAAHEIESLETGYLHIPSNAPRPGETVKVGQVIGYLLSQGETPPKISNLPASPQASKPPKEPAVEVAPEVSVMKVPLTESIPPMPRSVLEGRSQMAGPAARRLARQLGIDWNTVPTPDPTGRVVTIDVRRAHDSIAPTQSEAIGGPIASPRARRRAQEMGIDWRTIRGTGRRSRVRERDILSHVPSTAALTAAPTAAPSARSNEVPPATPGKHVPASKLRLVLAKRMVEGVTQAAPVTLHTKVDASALVAYRNSLKTQATGAGIPSYNDILIWLSARTLKEWPELNACWYRDGIYHYEEIHIATAVDSDAGLLAPVIRNVDQLTLEQITQVTIQLIADGRSGRLNQSALQGATFTVTNLGMFGVDAFTPVLNLPQAAILGVGRIVEEPVVRNGQLAVGQTLTLSLTFDHRVVDGAPAARWLQRLCELIQSLGNKR
jgi:pyruvate dehydrogenase E2 component (dihydrolipoamide acetyltransferase)